MQTMAGQEMPKLAVLQGKHLRSISNQAVLRVIRAWRQNRSDDFNQAYANAYAPMLSALDSAQQDVADYMVGTTPDVMQSLGSRNLGSEEFAFDTSRLVGWAGNGQNTFDNLWSSVLLGKQSIADGVSTNMALTIIENSLALRSRTILADTARASSLLSAKSHSFTAHYVRMLTPPSCGRCAILAGMPSGRKAFERHPHCDCVAAWSTDERSLAKHYANATDYLNSLSSQDLAKTLGSQANAQAWKDGADLNQLVNAYRRSGSVRPAQLYGRTIKYTSEGTTKRGWAYSRMKQAGYVKGHVKYGSKYWRADRPRLMPESIYQVAGSDHAKAMRLLDNYGWL